MNYKNLKKIIDKIDLNTLNKYSFDECKSINLVIELLNKGKIRISNNINNLWILNKWIKKSILLYFKINKKYEINMGDITFNDKIPLKNNYFENNIRNTPLSIVRYGSFIGNNVILMPSFINIGAYVDDNTMIDTWATIGSCAQIGKNVHISGGVGIGGVLEPIQNNPVIIEDNCFIGSRSIIVEGVRIGHSSVIGANVVITSSTKIIDVSNNIEYNGYIPPNSVVIPGNYSKKFSSGTYNIPCALIIKKKNQETNSKVILNSTLR
ncbi:MAG: 2,3,4,5-tetrahydropyridine-2,6-dicarboxylate N-succinyltransferase [Bacteroides sp.]|nr:MAG: 2,3,4,5-tetrahydropyridine-2,6-dicarboxylate N-succinyltransferase [Bacteroides sp.]